MQTPSSWSVDSSGEMGHPREDEKRRRQIILRLQEQETTGGGRSAQGGGQEQVSDSGAASRPSLQTRRPGDGTRHPCRSSLWGSELRSTCTEMLADKVSYQRNGEMGAPSRHHSTLSPRPSGSSRSPCFHAKPHVAGQSVLFWPQSRNKQKLPARHSPHPFL